MAKTKVRFANSRSRLDHFHKYGGKVRAFTATQYESLAVHFFSAPVAGSTLQKTRFNGDLIRYNGSTQEFGVVSAAGIIKTYFIPDPAVHGYRTNLDYYNAQ